MALVALAALAFLLAASWRLSLPGLQYDECLAAAPAVSFVRGTELAEPMHIRPSVIHPFGRPLPVMIMPYIGPVKTLLHIPFFTVFGISTVTVRLLPLLAGLASLVLTGWIARRLWGRAVANLTMLLLALDPSWVFYITRDVGPAALAVLFKLLAVAAGLRWWQDRRLWDLAACGFFLGLGISHKVDFLWVVAALAVPLAVLAPRELADRLHGQFLRTITTGSIALLLGAAPIVAFNLATGGHTFGPFVQRLFATGPQSLLGGFFTALGTRLEQTAGLLDGGLVHRVFFGTPGPGGGWAWLVPALVAASLIWLLVAPRRSSATRLGRALMLHVAVLLVASCFSPTALGPHHLLTLYPALHLAMAVAAVDLCRRFAASRTVLAGVSAALVLLVGAVNLTAVLGIDQKLRTTGGTGFWSDAVTALADDLEARGEPVVVLDWGLVNNLIVLTEGRVALEPAYRELWRRPASQREMPEILAPYIEPGALYLLHAPGFARYRQMPDLFRAAAEKKGLAESIEARFHQRNGQEVYRLVRLVERTEPSSRPGRSAKRGAGPAQAMVRQKIVHADPEKGMVWEKSSGEAVTAPRLSYSGAWRHHG